MNFPKEKQTNILPFEIGYYGRPVSRLTRDELLDAIVELSRMYMELERKLKNYQRESSRGNHKD